MAEEEKFKLMLLINGNKEQKQHSLNSEISINIACNLLHFPKQLQSIKK